MNEPREIDYTCTVHDGRECAISRKLNPQIIWDQPSTKFEPCRKEQSYMPCPGYAALICTINPQRMHHRDNYGSCSFFLSVCLSVTKLAATYLVASPSFLMAFQMHDLCGSLRKCFVHQFWCHLLILILSFSTCPALELARAWLDIHV